MMITKRFLLRFFFGCEVIFFILLHLFGSRGLPVFIRLKKENRQLAFEITVLESEIKELEKTIIAWKNNPFYKEKIAREVLHMAKKGEQVYIIG